MSEEQKHGAADDESTERVTDHSPPVRVQVRNCELRIIQGPDRGKVFSLTKTCVALGKGTDNDIVLSDRSISRRHLQIRDDEKGFSVKDLDSTNGTFVNGTLVK